MLQIKIVPVDSIKMRECDFPGNHTECFFTEIVANAGRSLIGAVFEAGPGYFEYNYNTPEAVYVIAGEYRIENLETEGHLIAREGDFVYLPKGLNGRITIITAPFRCIVFGTENVLMASDKKDGIKKVRISDLKPEPYDFSGNHMNCFYQEFFASEAWTMVGGFFVADSGYSEHEVTCDEEIYILEGNCRFENLETKKYADAGKGDLLHLPKGLNVRMDILKGPFSCVRFKET